MASRYIPDHTQVVFSLIFQLECYVLLYLTKENFITRMCVILHKPLIMISKQMRKYNFYALDKMHTKLLTNIQKSKKETYYSKPLGKNVKDNQTIKCFT